MQENNYKNLFSNFSPDSKIWIFFSKEAFSTQQKDEIDQILSDFLPKWQAHGKDLSASYSFLHNHFLLVAVDSNQENASGCSIDGLMHSIQKIDKETNTNLLDRQWVPILDDGEISSVSFKEFLSIKKVKKNLFFFDGSLSKLSEFREQFLVEL